MNNPTGKEGQLYDLSDHEGKGRSACKTPIAFGRVVVQDEDHDNGVRLPDKDDVLGFGAYADPELHVVGIVIYEEQFPCACNPPSLPENTPVSNNWTMGCYADERQTLTVATSGRIYDRVECDVKPTDPVFFRTTIDASDPYKGNLGTLRNDDDGGDAVRLEGAKFTDISALAGEMAVVDLNMR